MTVAEFIELIADRFAAADLFYGHGTDNPLDEAVYLVCASLELDFFDEAMFQSRCLSEQEIALLEARAQQRIATRQPMAYLTGKAWFAGHQFHADARALVPRSPFAELILNEFAPLLAEAPGRVLDLCTGGGCIGIATALQFPAATVVLADISSEALALADSNIRLHQLQQRVTAVESDLFAALDGKFDLILCNPPYVSGDEIAALPAEYHQEPVLGLFSDDEGMQLPLQILRESLHYLAEDGLLIMEVGFSQETLTERLPEVPLLWLEFAQGGSGVFAITARELSLHQDKLQV